MVLRAALSAVGVSPQRGRWAVIAVLLAAGGCVSLAPYERLIADVPPERFLSVEGRKVYFEDVGSGPSVLLVHGFGGSSYAWRDVARELADEFRVISVDLAGFGFTQRPRRKQEYSRFAQGELLVSVLDALGLDKVHLVGHSYGGSVSVALAVRRPERVQSLVLVDSAAPDYPQARRTPWAAFRPLTAFFVRAVSLRRGRVESGLRRSVARDSIVTTDLIDEYWRRVRVEDSPRAFWALTAPLDDPQGSVSVAQLRVPTLVVWGEQDALIPAAGARQTTTQRIRDSRFVLLADVGHAPMEDAPLELAAALRRFFTGGLAAFDPR
jgi:pimeloyl-ACP methyl ester carboxylesterase